MDLVHDLLDKQLLDKHLAPMGRVDGVVLELRDDAPPRVAHVEIGGRVLARRLHPRLARWAAAVRHWWGNGRDARDASPARVPWTALRHDGLVWVVDVDGRDTPAFAWELWLRTHVIARVPGRGK